jgi:hypothetical protein
MLEELLILGQVLFLGPGRARPVSYASPQDPATEVTAETAATLAAASLAFNATDPIYAAQLVQQASDLLDLSSIYPGSYMNSSEPGQPANYRSLHLVQSCDYLLAQAGHYEDQVHFSPCALLLHDNDVFCIKA